MTFFPIPDAQGNPVKTGVLSESLRDAFYRLMTVRTFESFATKRAIGHGGNPAEAGKDTRYDSGEQLHDYIHGAVGGDLDRKGGVGVLGHMSFVPVAAFDPIFWLHHAYEQPPSVNPLTV